MYTALVLNSHTKIKKTNTIGIARKLHAINNSVNNRKRIKNAFRLWKQREEKGEKEENNQFHHRSACSRNMHVLENT